MKRVNVIGAGRIGAPVIAFLQSDTYWRLGAVLVRRAMPDRIAETTADQDAFLATDADLIVEAAGPDALRSLGERALAHCDVWTVSASALADGPFYRSLEAAGARHGHRLRVLWGAIAGLDGVATAAVDPQARLQVSASRPGMAHAAGEVFSGSVRDAARRYPHEINVAVAAAIAGPGVDATEIVLRDPGVGGAHTLGLTAHSRFGRFTATAEYRADQAETAHPVAACIIAALKREGQVIWAG